MSPANPRAPRLAFETRLTLLALAAGLPAVAATLGLLWFAGYSTKVNWTIAVPVVALWIVFALAARERVVRPLQTLSNLIAALQEGDYSIRARGGRPNDALDSVFREVNTLTAVLQEQRLSSVEANALLRAVMKEIDVAVFTLRRQRTGTAPGQSRRRRSAQDPGRETAGLSCRRIRARRISRR